MLVTHQSGVFFATQLGVAFNLTGLSFKVENKVEPKVMT